jgi:ABC-type iron transport system FetAB permease component
VHHPASDEELRLGCLAEAWAAISVGLVMIGFVALILFARQYLAAGLAALVALIVFVEAGFRRRLSQLITGLTGLLAFLATAVLVYQFFWAILVAVVLLAAAYLVVDNLRELWR